ncbi:MAG TPA: PIN domain-containing protein [Candidatus Nanoarchaeia archaeon]|nr:PIN domain-containing protein [Candidatus Nanoarchaeia archaeon]
MKYLIDSSAWTEYFRGSVSGEKVSRILEGENEIYTTVLNIGEVVSLFKREEKQFEAVYEGMVKRSRIAEITPKIAKEAGKLHGELKGTIKNLSLADALIAKTAESRGAIVLTQDSHFKHLSKAEFI